MDVAGLAARFIENQLDSLLHAANTGVKLAVGSLQKNLEHTYIDYLEAFLRRVNEVKTFVVRDRPIPLSHIYVPVDLDGSGEEYKAVGVRDLSEAYRPSLILGGAGTGKSLLMRHLGLDAIESASYVPVFVELRRLNDSEISLNQLVYKTAQDLGLNLSEDVFSKVLIAGKFILLFDGFDEVRQDKRSEATLQILDFTASAYGRTPVVVSSRPEPSLGTWPHFRNLRIKPLSLKQSVTLVQRLPIDREVKKAFIMALEESLYEKRESFATNPLLLSIMVLTFSCNAHIPLKRSLFLDKAYDVLFEQHDALKPAFRREKRSGLDIGEFAKIFSAFSLVSYDDERTRFTESYARELVEMAIETTGIATAPEAFVHDANQAVSLLVRDGLELAYAHRSFQEYFVARFIVDQADRDLRSDLLESYLGRAETDEVLDLAFEINGPLVERDYLKNKISPIRFILEEYGDIGELQLRDFFVRIGLKFIVRRETTYVSGRARGIGISVKYVVERGEFLKLSDLLVRLYHPQAFGPGAENSSWRDIVLGIWREEGEAEEVEWEFGRTYPPPLLSGLAGGGGRFSLSRLTLVRAAIAQMDKNAKRGTSVRELLKSRRQESQKG